MRYKSDVAIILLNFYPLKVVSRAIDSILQQTSKVTWTLYLGFHHRSKEHREAVLAACAGLPVHFVTIERDLIFDVRARDLVLQEALIVGDHHFLFFLDDDDEWHPAYLEKMTSPDAPFITCAKEVLDEETGKLTTVCDDYDYEGMGFHFGLWRNRHLPYFVKQWSDKYVYREFNQAYPDHPHINEPLYRVHQHRDSLTFQKSLGRAEGDKSKVAARELVMVRPRDPLTHPIHQDCNSIAELTGAKVLPVAHLSQRNERPRIFMSALSTLSVCLNQVGSNRQQTGDVVVAIIDQSPELLFQPPRQKESQVIDLMRQADALMLCDPVWIESYETIQPNCLPVGVPSLVTEDTIQERCVIIQRQRPERKAAQKTRLAILTQSSIPKPFLAKVLGDIPGKVVTTFSLSDSDVCWCPDIGQQDWGRDILKAYEQGIACVSTNRTSTAKILFGGTPLLVDSMNPTLIALRIGYLLHGDSQAMITEALPLFRRCFGPFYWLNSFRTYLASLLP